MTPQLQQAIKLLQLSRLELEQFVETQLSENPCLEEQANDSNDELSSYEHEATETQVVNDRLEEASSIVDKVSKDDKPDVDWDSLARYEESRHQASAGGQRGLGEEDDTGNYENLATKANTIQEHLMQQVTECDFQEQERIIATVIVGNIDDRGYLTMGLDEICSLEKFDLDLAEGVLDTIQRFDPSGVGARTLQECLLNQLKFSKIKNSIVETIIQNHIFELENRNYSAIAKALKISLEKVFENVAVIVGLEPIPGRQFSADATHYIIPDVFVFKMGSEWAVSMNEDGLPRLKVSPVYKKMLEGKSTPLSGKSADKDYLKDKIKTADWLIKSLQQRQTTIFRVTEKIVEKQKEFFEYGVQYLRPMTLKNIAEILELHESTISRVTTSKYVHTPRGVFELKYFFNSGISSGDGADVANEAVKNKIEGLVKAEDPKRPYSDQQIVEILEKENIQLARRTVAKYREQLNILPSSKRKNPF
ncbi:MAG: RNA polymerase factor sigma-54 [Proteobacteria bacterium]|nr:RNA polymerase factor sigma-54 [Pseudomonadota bacterium]